MHNFLAFNDNKARFRYGKTKHKKIQLYDSVSGHFPAGLTGLVMEGARKKGFDVQLLDKRKTSITPLTGDELERALYWLRDYQREAVDAMRQRTRGIVWAPTASGKCLAPETPVLMYDGTIRLAHQILPGDLLMGSDSKPRTVKSVCSGSGPRYRIVPIKGDAWECNDSHILTLKHTETGGIIDIPLSEYVRKSNTFKHLHKLFCVGVEFEQQEPLPVDPYFLGIWIGDGRKSLKVVEITKEDPEVVDAIHETAKAWGCLVKTKHYPNKCPSWRVVGEKGRPNKLLPMMRTLFPCTGEGSRGVDIRVLTCSRQERLELLAGILDTDGHLGRGYFEVVQRQGALSNSIAYIARSLGFRVTHSIKTVGEVSYDRWSILGDVDKIPTRIPRKKALPRRMNKDAARVGFKVEHVSDDAPYSGFTLDGDGRFLLGDFTVTHNTEIFTGIVRSLPGKWLMIVHNKKLMHDAADRYNLRALQWWIKNNVPNADCGPSISRTKDAENVDKLLDRLALKPEDVIDVAGRLGDGKWEPRKFTTCTFQTLARGLRKKHGAIQDVNAHKRVTDLLASADGIIVDECHVLAADSFWNVLMHATNAYYRIGLSGTPLARGDKRSILAVAALGPVQYRITADRLKAAGVIAKPRIRLFPCAQQASPSTCSKCRGSGCMTCGGTGRAKQSWHTIQKNLITTSKVRNKLIVDIVKNYATRPVLVFVEAVDHGKILQKSLQSEGISTTFTWGKDTTENRNAAIQKLVDGGVEVLIASRIFQEGVDIPPIRSVVMASGGKSIIAALQKIGRGMRIDKDKKEFDVFDIKDSGHPWLSRHTTQRIKAYTSEGHTVVEDGDLFASRG